MGKRLIKLAAAAVIYLVLAVYLYQPYWGRFNKLEYLVIFNSCFGGLGCFILSSRWVCGFWGCFFSGLLYGFGPFFLGFAGYHPAGGFLMGCLPWFFLPAVFGPRGKWRFLRIPLAALPFLVIVVFFQVSAYYRLFAIPTQDVTKFGDLWGLVAPLLMAERKMVVLGFYHVPIAALLIGFSMLFAARRYGIMLIFISGTVLAFCESFFGVSPVIWLSIPALCCSVLVGEGVAGLSYAGFSDRRWVLGAGVMMVVFSIMMLLFAVEYFQKFAGLGAGAGKLLVETAKMYALGAISVGIIFFISRGRRRFRWVRLGVLCIAMGVDVFLGARFVVDKIF